MFYSRRNYFRSRCTLFIAIVLCYLVINFLGEKGIFPRRQKLNDEDFVLELPERIGSVTWKNRRVLQNSADSYGVKNSSVTRTMHTYKPTAVNFLTEGLQSTPQSFEIKKVPTTSTVSRINDNSEAEIRTTTTGNRKTTTGDVGTSTANDDQTANITEIMQNVSTVHEIQCTPPAYHEFPPDLFTSEQRSNGAIIIHTFVVLYMFYALAVVCDDYFVSSLEKCCDKIGISEDVAGATFMAIGSSAPELFTAILGVFVTKGDVGTGTIVGSAVFNVLFVVGLCGIFAGQAVPLNWWPLFRDSVFYSFTVIILIVIIFDNTVTWMESLTMLLLYVVYILVMKFNTRIHHFVMTRTPLGGAADDMQFAAQGILEHGDKKCYNSYVPFNNDLDQVSLNTFSTKPADESIRTSIRRWTLFDASLRIMMTRHFRPITRFRMACRRLIVEHLHMKKKSLNGFNQTSVEIDGIGTTASKRFSSVSRELDGWKQIPSRGDGLFKIVRWVIDVPVFASLYYTVPDCSKGHWEKWFLVTFSNSVLWIAVFSYIMVWMVTLIGYTLGIPDTIMGITFLAAGTSVPDAMASYLVAKQGQGDMAVSNTIGSNVFDILVGLAFPWFLQTAMVEPGSTAHINSKGLIYSVILLFLTIIVTIGGVHYCRWQLTPRLGLLLISVYVIFLIISILTEFNVLGYVNLPMCQE